MRVEATTGLDSEVFTELVTLVHDRVQTWEPARGRTPVLGLARAVQLVLFLARHNSSQAAAAELFAVSQATVSRLWRRLLPVITLAIAELLPQLVELRGRIVLVDGTLIPTWNWRDTPGLYSGKHRDHGMNLQVAASTCGRTMAAGIPQPGSMHDSLAFTESGLAQAVEHHAGIADVGYLGHQQLTVPPRKHPGRHRTPGEKAAAASIAAIRWAVEQAIAHLKTWRILSSRYRGPLNWLPTVVYTVVSIELFRTWR